jgi:AraC-like DNA-binding protein
MVINGLKKTLTLLKTNRLILSGLIILPFLLIVFPLNAFFNSELVIFPADDIGNRISALDDDIWQGKSVIEGFTYDTNKMSLKYYLKEGAPSPLVFITINLGSIEKPFDLSQFDSVSLRIKEATNKRFMIFIKTYLPGISLAGSKNGQTLRHNQYILQLIPGTHQYIVPLKDFETPVWWIESMNVNEKQLPEESFRKVLAFDMQFNKEGSDYQINKSEKIVFENITFHRKLSLMHYGLIGFVVIYTAGLGAFLIRGRVQKKKGKLLQHKSLELSSYREMEVRKIKDFIEANYHVANISTQLVSKKLGIPSAKVFELIKEEFHLTFKQLINQMRISEAKRLLKETDLRIADIAMNLGFNNISYFNNLFKMYEGISPSGYREKESPVDKKP